MGAVVGWQVGLVSGPLVATPPGSLLSPAVWVGRVPTPHPVALCLPHQVCSAGVAVLPRGSLWSVSILLLCGLELCYYVISKCHLTSESESAEVAGTESVVLPARPGPSGLSLKSCV